MVHLLRSGDMEAMVLVMLAVALTLAGGYPTPLPPPSAEAPEAPGLEQRPEEDYGTDEGNVLEELLAEKYGAQLYGNPDNDTGSRVDEWRTDSGVNPEELGEYAEGDILFPASSHNDIRHASARWPGGLIPYRLAPGFSRADLQNIQQAINAYHRLTCLRFVPYSGRERDYLVITHDHTGCWSAVGRTGGQQQLNLQSPGCTTLVGTIEHEMMHAAGFLHEHTRWDRDRYITVHWQNIQSGKESNFRLASREASNAFGVPYDYGSVMHYSLNAFSKNGQRTISPKEKGVKEPGQRKGFSKGDIKRINRMYQCTEKAKGAASSGREWRKTRRRPPVAGYFPVF